MNRIQEKGRDIYTKRCKMILVCFAVLSSLVMTSCAPVISRETLKEVDQNVQFKQILEAPEAYRGRIVLLGGKIIKTENFSDKTIIVILQYPLGFRNRPTAKDASKGRFIVSVPGFLDPTIYRAGRNITVVGAVAGKEVRPLDEIEYAYPIIVRREIYLWPLEELSTTDSKVHFGIGISIGF